MAGLREIATDLYGLPLAEFIPARNTQAAEAKASGDGELARQLRALRKPNAAAWAVNALAREEQELVQEILDLGEELRDAQGDADGSRTRLLDRTRRELTKTAIAAATRLAKASGGTLSADAASGVEETLRAAMTDPDAGEVVHDGLLVTSFAASPFEPVDLTDVVAVPRGGSRRPRPATQTKARTHPGPSELDRKRLAKAEAGVKIAHDEVETASKAANSRAEEYERLRDKLAGLKEEAARLQQDIADTERAMGLAGIAAEHAERGAASAKSAAEKAEANLDRLR